MNRNILIALFSICWVASVRAEVSYRIYPLGGGSGAAGLNDQGVVVGGMPIGGQETAVVWHEGIATPIPVKNGIAWDINDSGVVVGSADERPFSWNGKVVTWLPGDGEPTAINSSGEIVGRADDSDNHFQATIWKDGTESMPYLHDPYTSYANGVNDEGDVVGQSWDYTLYAFLDHNGEVTKLPGGVDDDAVAINNKDQIVGYSLQKDHEWSEAALWQNGTLKRLAALPGNPNDDVYDINDNGWIVGDSEDANFNNARATLWINEAPIDLNSLIPTDSGWVLQSGSAINNRGQIVGSGVFKGHAEGFIMTPSTEAIPLPSPVLIGAITLPLAIWMSRGRIRKSA